MHDTHEVRAGGNKRMNFEEVFKTATKHPPYPYQARLATGAELSQFVDIPTGLGKTAAVVLSWVFRRRFSENMRDQTPRRLVYCLPMRTLVEQTKNEAILWLHRLELLGGNVTLKEEAGREEVESYAPSWDDPSKIAVTVLMGGVDKDDWDSYPERDAIIIGTQDMLLSRALNRGYGMSRYRWPMHFGLLNNDCLWVMDEVQLMGVGVETSAQLDAFRGQLGAEGATLSVWMSATLGQEQIETVDHPKPLAGWVCTSLGNTDFANPTLQKRDDAKKSVNRTSVILTKESEEESYAKDAAVLLISKHKCNTLTLAIVNTVERAQAIYSALLERGRTEQDTTLLHSRFREPERKERMELLGKAGDRIIVATQVVEAGMNMSAHTLVTELAPWPSLVQRFGRCNRFDEHSDAIIEWLNIDTSDAEGVLALPYETVELDTARELISNITDASLKTLRAIKYEPLNVIRPVIRKKDILDLFDTTPDLSGNDLDISCYIRDGDDKDVQVYWREIPEGGPSEALSRPRREELCSVPVWKANDYLKRYSAWRWDPLEARWTALGKASEIKRSRPGQILLLDSNNGGYTSSLGWIGAITKKPKPVAIIPLERKEDEAESSMNGENETYIGKWVSLATHIGDVSREVIELSKNISLLQEFEDSLATAAQWHDLGKAHEAFQNMLLSGRANEAVLRKGSPWAKSDDKPSRRRPYWVVDANGNQISRPYFRHELASAIAWLQTRGNGRQTADLVAYLIASHHGKVRMSIRSLPQENEPPEDVLFARGIWQGDKLPSVDGVLVDGVELDLSFMQMGEGSWLERMLCLRDDPKLGPFRLTFLETVLRVADWRASKKEGG